MASIFAIIALVFLPRHEVPRPAQSDQMVTWTTSLKLFSVVMEPSTSYRLENFSMDGRVGVRLTKSQRRPMLETSATVIPSRDGKNYELSVPKLWLDNVPGRESVPGQVLAAGFMHYEKIQFDGTGWSIKWEPASLFYKAYKSWVPEDFTAESIANGDYVVRVHRMPLSPGLGMSIVIDRMGKVKKSLFGL